MAPEQITGPNLDRRADIFALGTTLWELTVGRRLFKAANDVETMKNVREAKIPDPRSIVPSFPAALATIVMRALARDRDERYATAAELAKELDAYVMAGGRIINPATLLEIMTNLFPGERDRDASWFDAGELPIRTVPLAPIVLPSMVLESDESHLAPIPGQMISATAGVEPTEPDTVRAPGPFSDGEVRPGGDRIDAAPSPSEPSVGEVPLGVPRGPLTRLSQGEIAMFAVLALLVVIAIATAVFASLR
jgi:serine/threonine protein kinase